MNNAKPTTALNTAPVIIESSCPDKKTQRQRLEQARGNKLLTDVTRLLSLNPVRPLKEAPLARTFFM